METDSLERWRVNRDGKPGARAKFARLETSGFGRSGDGNSKPNRTASPVEHSSDQFDLAPNLSERVGSLRWFRGFGTLVGLGVLAAAFWPNLLPIEAASASTMEAGTVLDEYRSHMITPLALGSDTGRRMAPGTLVRPLAAPPDRPQLLLQASLANGDTLAGLLQRAGLSDRDIAQAEAEIARAFPISELSPGTVFDITLGRRSSPELTRPLDALRFRARFDLALELKREGGGLTVTREYIRVDETPLRITGMVGDSLYRSARAAGAPSSAVQSYLKVLDDHVDVGTLRPDDTFDLVVAHRRAATGERQAGELLYAAIGDAERPRLQLARFGSKGDFFDADGRGEERGGLLRPVPGAMTSGYGMRRHPILGYKRMHAGLDFRGRTGTPIRAVTDGRVTRAGRMGGCGIGVMLNHAGDLATRYCHMSGMAVSAGQYVTRGQVIGYIGSTGLSTGPHLHYEMYRGGRHVDPRTVDFTTREQLGGSDLARLRERMARLRQVEPGAALAPLKAEPNELPEPKREIEKLDQVRRIR
jgi:murein DD-endopeptidase MepM/ murein hydrolase activator NlpD